MFESFSSRNRKRTKDATWLENLSGEISRRRNRRRAIFSRASKSDTRRGDVKRWKSYPAEHESWPASMSMKENK